MSFFRGTRSAMNLSIRVTRLESNPSKISLRSGNGRNRLKSKESDRKWKNGERKTKLWKDDGRNNRKRSERDEKHKFRP